MEIICRRDCRFYRRGSMWDWCNSPQQDTVVDPVTGPYRDTQPCSKRRHDCCACGPEARWMVRVTGLQSILRRVGIL